MKCEWCGKEITGWYLSYKNHNFCRDNDDLCLKNYLFEEHDEQIEMDKTGGDVEYDMSKVDEYYFYNKKREDKQNENT